MVVALAVALAPSQVAGQESSEGEDTTTESSVTLVYEREVFTYRGANRRDPFSPLTDDADVGPRFESLTLQGIIYGTGRGGSLALLADSDGRVYRVRVGDRLGNSRVIEIGPLRVVLAVENFGSIRQEMLELPSSGGTR